MHRRIFLILALAVVMTGVAAFWWALQRPLGPINGPRIRNERALAAFPDDWPHLRGPNCDGVSAETDLAASWPEEGPPILWARELDQGYSGFVVAHGKALTQFQQLSGQYLLCFDMETGDELWRLRYDRAWQPSGAYPGPYASPTWDHQRVLFASPTGLVGCADADSGDLIWSRDLLRDFAGKGAGFGYACTPLVEDGLVFFPVGGKGASVVALHAHDGTVAWQAGDDLGSYCPALPITLDGRRLLVAYLRNALVLHEPQTGCVVSRQVLSSNYDEHSAWPLYREPHLVLTAPFRAGAQCLRLAFDGDDVSLTRTWTAKDLSNDVLSSILHDGHIYGFDLKGCRHAYTAPRAVSFAASSSKRAKRAGSPTRWRMPRCSWPTASSSFLTTRARWFSPAPRQRPTRSWPGFVFSRTTACAGRRRLSGAAGCWCATSTASRVSTLVIRRRLILRSARRPSRHQSFLPRKRGIGQC